MCAPQENAIDFADACGTPELALNLTCTDEVLFERIMRRGQLEREAGGAGRADDNMETALKRIAG